MQPYSHQSSVHLIFQPQNMPFYSAQPNVYAHHICHLPNSQQPVHMHALPVPLQLRRIEQPNNPQQFLVQQRSEPYYVQPGLQPTQRTSMSEMTKFLVKEDILRLRLSKFMDIPGTFVSWKTTFQSVYREIEVSPLEELDLLQQYLGPESLRYAASIRPAYSHNPMIGIEKIWDRLNDKYERPEVIEASLKAKLLALSKNEC